MGDMLKPGVGVVLCANGEMKRLEKEARFWSLSEMQKAVGGLIEQRTGIILSLVVVGARLIVSTRWALGARRL